MSFYSAGLDDDYPTQRESLRGADTPSTDALANMRTNHQGRIVLGITAKYLQAGYEHAQRIPTSLWAGLLTRKLDGSAATAKQAIELLDRNRQYAEKVYRNLPNNGEPLTPVNRKKVATAYKQAASSLQLVSTADAQLNRSFLADVADALRSMAKKVVREAGRAAKEGTGIGKTLLWLAGGGLVVGAGWYFLKARKTATRFLPSHSE